MAPFDAVIPLSKGFGSCNNGHCYCVDTKHFSFLYSFILWFVKRKVQTAFFKSLLKAVHFVH